MGRARKQKRHPAEDLFGEIPVTWDDIWNWVEVIAGIPRNSWRASWYVEAWNVPDKIRAAKRAGEWPLENAAIAPGPDTAQNKTTFPDGRKRNRPDQSDRSRR